MPQISDNVAGRPITFKAHADNRVTLKAIVTATAVVGTPQKITWDKDGWSAAALGASTGTFATPTVCYLGIPETAGTTGQVIEYCIAGPTKMLSTGCFIAGYPATWGVGAAVISATTALTTPLATMFEVGIWREALPTTVVSTTPMKVYLYGHLYVGAT